MRRAISPSSRTSGDVHCTSASTVCVERKLDGAPHRQNNSRAGVVPHLAGRNAAHRRIALGDHVRRRPRITARQRIFTHLVVAVHLAQQRCCTKQVRHGAAAQRGLAVLFDAPPAAAAVAMAAINVARVGVRAARAPCGGRHGLLRARHVGNLLQRHLAAARAPCSRCRWKTRGARPAYSSGRYTLDAHAPAVAEMVVDRTASPALFLALGNGAAGGLHRLHRRWQASALLPGASSTSLKGACRVARAEWRGRGLCGTAPSRAASAFEHRLSGNELYLVHCAGALGTEHHLRRRVKRNAFLSRDKFFLRSHRLAARERRCALLDAAAGQRGNYAPVPRPRPRWTERTRPGRPRVAG